MASAVGKITGEEGDRMEQIAAVAERMLSSFGMISITDIIDIAIMAFLIYKIIGLIRVRWPLLSCSSPNCGNYWSRSAAAGSGRSFPAGKARRMSWKKRLRKRWKHMLRFLRAKQAH